MKIIRHNLLQNLKYHCVEDNKGHGLTLLLILYWEKKNLHPFDVIQDPSYQLMQSNKNNLIKVNFTIGEK